MEEICYVGLEENIIKLDILSEICPVYANVALIIIQILLYYTYFDPFRKTGLFSHWPELVDCSNTVESELKLTRGGVWTPCPPPLDPRMYMVCT